MRSTRLVLTASLFALLAVPALAGDIIVLTSGKVQGNPKAEAPFDAAEYAESTWTVVDERLDFIYYKLRGVNQTQKLPSKDVAQVLHDPSANPQLARAAEAERQGDYAQARAQWESLAETNAPWAKAMGAYRAAATYWMEGRPAEAAAALEAFQKDHPKSLYVPQAIQMSARALQAQGKIEDARKAFASIKSLPGVSDASKFEADYWTTWIDEKIALSKGDQDGLKKARDAYKLLRGALTGKSDLESVLLAKRCQLGVASCQIAMGDWQEAKTDLERVIGSTKDKMTLAGAHTLIGNALIRENASGHDKSVYRKALDHFLRVATLYGDAPGAEDYHAESLYQAGQMFMELRPTKEQDAEKKKRWESYARNEWRQCQRLYPGSHWAQESARAERSN